jgi:hypothetical protein
LVYPSIAFFLFLIQGLFSTCISWLFTSIGFFLEVDLHTQMLVSILGFSKTPIFFKHKFNPITNNTRMTTLQMKFQVMIPMNVLSMMHWIVGGIKMEM